MNDTPKTAIAAYEAFIDSVNTEFEHEEANSIIYKMQDLIKTKWPEFQIGKEIAKRRAVDDWEMIYALIRVLVKKGALRLEDLK